MTLPKLYELVADKVHLILATTLWILFLSASWVERFCFTCSLFISSLFNPGFLYFVIYSTLS